MKVSDLLGILKPKSAAKVRLKIRVRMQFKKLNCLFLFKRPFYTPSKFNAISLRFFLCLDVMIATKLVGFGFKHSSTSFFGESYF